MKRRLILVTSLLLFQGFWEITTSADEGYITTYSHHIMRGEKEIMLMNDFTSPSDHKREKDGHNNYFSQMLEVEFAPTDQLVLEFMAEGFEDTGTGDVRFTGFRYEARYRLFKEEVPLNPMVYAEYEDLHVKTRYKMEVSGWVDPPYSEEEEEELSNREHILESRLIVSYDIDRWNLAFNWINETDFGSGETAFGYSLGILFRIPHTMAHTHHRFIRPMAFALELFGALGDTKKFALEPSRQEHYLQPSITFHVGKSSMLNIGAGIGLTRTSDNMVRVSWGWMF